MLKRIDVKIVQYKNRHNFFVLEYFGALKKDVSFTNIRVSTPGLLRSPFWGPHLVIYLPSPLRRYLLLNRWASLRLN